jgi:light-regulated signal transduction histidine kinase (bacteriophytochrome)
MPDKTKAQLLDEVQALRKRLATLEVELAECRSVEQLRYQAYQELEEMGLMISRSIIEAHGGRLEMTAKAGRGVTFQFTLPTHIQGFVP